MGLPRAIATSDVDAFGIAFKNNSNPNLRIEYRSVITAFGRVIFVDQIQTDLPSNSLPLDLVFDNVNGSLYIADSANDFVYQLDSANNLSILIGSGLNKPSYLAINGNNLYISDTGSGNILEFELRPVPFEFNPTLGLGIIGGVWLVRKNLKKPKKD